MIGLEASWSMPLLRGSSPSATDEWQSLGDELMREFVGRDVAGLRQRPENEGTVVADNISSLLQRVSASSIQEIDRLISDLKILRERLNDEGRRVEREIVEFASLNQATMQSTKVIAESLSHWKRAPDAPSIDERA
jgi:hypothetical protein